MDAGIDVAGSTRGGAYAEEQESRDAHAQQDGEEELGAAGGVHGCCRGGWRARRAVEDFLGAGGVPPRLTALSAQRRPDVGRTVLESSARYAVTSYHVHTASFAACDALFLVC